jgi:hypothetical protein
MTPTTIYVLEDPTGVRYIGKTIRTLDVRQRGKKHSPEWCAAISAGSKGKSFKGNQWTRKVPYSFSHTPESRAKMSVSQKARRKAEKRR